MSSPGGLGRDRTRQSDKSSYDGNNTVEPSCEVVIATDNTGSKGVAQRTRDALTSRGHELLDVTYEGTVQAISIDMETKELSAVCDVRKGDSQYSERGQGGHGTSGFS
jgi:hypothetical protein